jgi:hypothetical protein
MKWETVAMGALDPAIATLAAEDAVLAVLSRHAETISSTAFLGLFAGVALVATAIPRVVAGR